MICRDKACPVPNDILNSDRHSSDTDLGLNICCMNISPTLNSATNSWTFESATNFFQNNFFFLMIRRILSQTYLFPIENKLVALSKVWLSLVLLIMQLSNNHTADIQALCVQPAQLYFFPIRWGEPTHRLIALSSSFLGNLGGKILDFLWAPVW